MKRQLAVILALAPAVLVAEIKLATPFTDGVVLQRQFKVPVWGKAEPGAEVKVEFAGQQLTAKAGESGCWRVELAPMEASAEGRELVVTSGGERATVKDVLVGEVWLASGQSNMDCPITGNNPRYRDANGALVTGLTRQPLVRFVRNPLIAKNEPWYDYTAAWKTFEPQHFHVQSGNLSAVAFYYALELHHALGIPVGIIDSSWGGSPIECWIPKSTFASFPGLAYFAGLEKTSTMWNGMVAAYAPFACRGMIWYQGCANNWDPGRYDTLMHALYAGWSQAFGNPAFKLYFAQLAPYRCSWYGLQLAQARFAAEEKNAGMAVLVDVGNYDDIHPNGKEIVARRLAAHALIKDYGFASEYAECESPQPVSARSEEGRMYVTFNHVNAFYVYNDDRSAPSGFELAGEDGRYYSAKLDGFVEKNYLDGGNTLSFSSAFVPHPVKIRYLYHAPWKGSVYSDYNLPIGPFELDLSQRVATFDGVITEKTPGWRFAVAKGDWEFTFNPLEGWYPDKGGKLISPRIRLPKPPRGQEYYKISFDASAQLRAFEAVAFYDKDGNMIADNYDVVYAGEMRHYERVIFAHEGAVEAEIFFQSKKGYEIRNLKLERTTVTEAAKFCDRVAARLPGFQAKAEHADMFKGAPKTLESLRKGDRTVRILFLGDSIIQDTFHSQVHALFQREFPQARVEWLMSVRGGTGCWYYRLDDNYRKYVTDQRPDCVILGGISNWKAVRDEYPVSGNQAYLEVCDRIQKDGIELICLSPGLSVDTRMKEWSKEYTPLPKMEFTADKLAQALALTIDKDKPKSPSGLDAQGLEELKAECARRGIGFLDVFTPAYKWLYESGLPWSWYSRDYCHSGELGKQVLARTIEAYFFKANHPEK